MQAEKTILTFQAPIALAEKLRRLADKHERSLSAEVRLALRAHLQQQEAR
jgi:predicted transcriptional regulator